MPPVSEVTVRDLAPGRLSADPMLKPPTTTTKKAGASLLSGLSGISDKLCPRLDRSMALAQSPSCRGSKRRTSPISTCRLHHDAVSDIPLLQFFSPNVKATQQDKLNHGPQSQHLDAGLTQLVFIACSCQCES